MDPMFWSDRRAEKSRYETRLSCTHAHPTWRPTHVDTTARCGSAPAPRSSEWAHTERSSAQDPSTARANSRRWLKKTTAAHCTTYTAEPAQSPWVAYLFEQEEERDPATRERSIRRQQWSVNEQETV